MARTVEEGFRLFLSRLTPTATESSAAKSHRASIKSCLEDSLGMTNFFRTGSLGNGTSISHFSDVDYFAVIPAENLKKNSGTSLADLRSSLEARFPRTGVYVDCPAVGVPFGAEASESTEVVPAYYRGAKSDFDVYGIPDCSGGWMGASPDAHNAYVRSVDGDLGNKVKPLVRFIKAWKYYRNVPVSSFYLELRAAKYASGEKSIVYDIDVYRILKLLYDKELASIQDPMGVSGYISPCGTDAQKRDAISKLGTAVSRAEKAVEGNKKGNPEAAFYWWNLLYDNHFPSY